DLEAVGQYVVVAAVRFPYVELLDVLHQQRQVAPARLLVGVLERQEHDCMRHLLSSWRWLREPAVGIRDSDASHHTIVTRESREKLRRLLLVQPRHSGSHFVVAPIGYAGGTFGGNRLQSAGTSAGGMCVAPGPCPEAGGPTGGNS